MKFCIVHFLKYFRFQLSRPIHMEKKKGKVKKTKKAKSMKGTNSLDELKKSINQQKQALTKIIKNIQHEKNSNE